MELYETVEYAINEEDSEEDIAAEYMESLTEEHEFNEQYNTNEYSKEMKEPSLVKRVSEYISDNSCCSNKCCKTWKIDHLKKHEEDINYLTRNCALKSEKTRYSEQRQRIRFTFRYEPFGVMCASAFRLLFDISINVFKGLLAHLKTNNMSVLPPLHGNKGKQSCKPDTLANRGVTEKVVEFMLALSEDQGEFSPSKDKKRDISEKKTISDLLWLPACLNRSALFHMYNYQCADYPIGRTKFTLLLKTESRLKHIRIRSAVINKARVIDGNDVYDWKKVLSPYFNNFDGISQFQHFAVDSTKPGIIFIKYGFDDDKWKKRKLLKSAKSIKLKQFKNMPKYINSVGFKGGKTEKEKALYENLRQYVKEEWKDELCPNPDTVKFSVRIEKSCPDWLIKAD